MNDAVCMKALALVEGGAATDEFPNGSFDVILSAPTLDRDDEVIDAKAFDPLPEHIVFDIDHGMTVESTVGSGKPFYDAQGRLRVTGGFASTPKAQEVRALVNEGHIRSTSVTFMAAKRQRDSKGIMHVQKAELLNGTFASVPTNREAVVLSSKAVDLKAGARNSATDGDRLQSIHDMAVENGATCAAPAKSYRVRKSIVGSVEALRDRVGDALTDAYADRYWGLRGVLTDTVVFDAFNGDCMCTFQQSYTDDGQVVTLEGEPTEVDIWEIVTPDADADTEPDATFKSATSDATSAADAAAPAAADAAEVASKAADESQIEARRRTLENSALVEFGAA